MRRSLFVVGLVVLVATAGCRRDGLPEQGSQEYRDAVAAFYTGRAALQVGEDRRAEEQFLRVTELAPEEPSAWANLGLLALRRNELDLASERLHTARDLAPQDGRIHYLLGVLDAMRGDPDGAIAHLRTAHELDPSNLKAAYALAEQIEQRGDEGARQEVREVIGAILEADPDNLAMLVERARLAALDGDPEALQASLQRLEEQSDTWSAESQEQLRTVRAAAAAGQMNEVATELSFLNNVLKRENDYRESLAAVRTQAGEPDDLLASLAALPAPSSEPAAPDDSLQFDRQALLDEVAVPEWDWVRAVTLSPEGLPVILAAAGDRAYFEDGTTLSLPGPVEARGMAASDFNYDFRVDVAFAGPDGFRVFRQEADSSFTDITSTLAAAGADPAGAYRAVWSVDVDLEGDLDLILSRVGLSPLVLRNNGDGTFSRLDVFGGVSDAADFMWADLDADGDPDAVFADASGALHLYENRRSRGFAHRALSGNARATTAADLNNDGIFELVTLGSDGIVRTLQQGADGVEEMRSEVASWDLAVPDSGGVWLAASDVDNNGSLDVLASAGGETAAWLSRGDGTFSRLNATLGAATYSAADVTGAGRLDLIGVSSDGAALRLVNRGTKNYHSKSIRPQAAEATGDQRINPFGLGGEIEVRSGLLFQKQPIADPVVHFGLGEQLVVDVARIAWPNGDIQAEFDLLSDETVQARQRLKGSCPWLFTFDGSEMRFVTDFIWRSPLGLRINAQETAGVMMTEDRVKIEGSELRPRDGAYDVRITAELWESHFFDHVSLMVVDHPAETEIFIDERFVFPPQPLEVHSTGALHPVRGVLDDTGADVTDRIRAEDGEYLASFDRGQYQGVAKTHSIEIDLSDAPSSGPLYLLASGWVRPTDSSINVALSQGTHTPPTGLRLDVPGPNGAWLTVYPNLGFPAGKHKTIVIEIGDIFPAEQRVRLTTNLEIYWDALWWAEGRPDAELRTTRLNPDTAELRYRGYSVASAPHRSRPEVPVYDSLASTTQVWRDLEGYYTRFGDVRELLREVDDRYVIMNAGDELAFRFPAHEDPPEGWVRDFVLIGDGWVKDGDYNTYYSETVRPLPAHDATDYTAPRGTLEEDPVYRRHADDWRRYHTRYVTSRGLSAAMSRR